MDAPATPPESNDPWLWLEDVLGERSLAWVRERNAASREVLAAPPSFTETRDRIRAVLDSKAQIPHVSRRGEWFYNFWRDAEHPRGVLRRTTLEDYRRDEPAWETVFDLDLLAREEDENWVLSGVLWSAPDYRRALLRLSRGGADATVVREWDVVERRFVVEGFNLPEAKTIIGWEGADSVLVSTDFGPGSTTDSGYPRIVKRWRRGQPLEQAETLYEGVVTDMMVTGFHDDTPGHERTFVTRMLDFFRSELYLVEAGGLRRIERPSDSTLSFWGEWVLVRLKSDWEIGGRRWAAGSLLISRFQDYLDGRREFEALFTPTPTRTLDDFVPTATQVLVVVQENVATRLEAWRREGERWVARDVEAPANGILGVQPLHDHHLADDPLAETYFQNSTSFLSPDQLGLRDAVSDASELLKSRPHFFDASPYTVDQRFATSDDGTRVPYFIVHRKDMALDGTNPTLMYGYGGYQIPLLPEYSAALGIAWLERGGVYVLTNIRGGGEFGPAWHKAAQRDQRQRSFEDFASIARHLVETGVTSPRRLGIEGGSNGGLLVSAVMVQWPELFNAVVCQVPLTDMRRFHLMLAGASWVAEFGNPEDPADWAFLEKYSPYHNVRADRRYPAVLFTTSTRDDRVHPAHARKMAARMLDQGHEVFYYENIEGGHGGAADNAQRADLVALEYEFLWRQLGG